MQIVRNPERGWSKRRSMFPPTHSPAPFIEHWRIEFDRQCTRDLLQRLDRRIDALVKRYQRSTPRDGADRSTMDRIHTAVVKLLDGSRVWDPTRVDLEGFVLGTIASELAAEMRRAKRFPEVSIEPMAAPEDDYTGEPVSDKNRAAPARPEPYASAEHESIDGAWRIAMPHLRERAANELDVLALLNAYDEGTYQRGDVMHRLTWDSARYQRTYRRLRSIATAADEGVRDLILRGLAS
ncbi:MAG: hypothetical protein KIT31_05275 [Deltaproteobacteria bacterium]|nr:hypothetical protein [Deltaproteobacteria bacterium]